MVRQFLVLFVALSLSACSTAISFRDNYEDAVHLLENGMTISEGYTLDHEGKYIYIQKDQAKTRYGINVKRKAIVIEYTTDF